MQHVTAMLPIDLECRISSQLRTSGHGRTGTWHFILPIGMMNNTLEVRVDDLITRSNTSTPTIGTDLGCIPGAIAGIITITVIDDVTGMHLLLYNDPFGWERKWSASRGCIFVTIHSLRMGTERLIVYLPC